MTTLPLPAGPTNKDLIDIAYLGLGVSDAMFGRTDEEYAAGIAQLRAMMMEYPFDRLGYDMSNARPAEKSGIPAKWSTAVGLSLGERIGATIGKTLSPQFNKVRARAFSALAAAVHTFPAMAYAQGTPVGAGHRRSGAAYFDGPIGVAGA